MKQRLKDARERLHKRMNFASLFEFIIIVHHIQSIPFEFQSLSLSLSLSLHFISFHFISFFSPSIVLSLSLKNEERKPFLHNFTMTLQYDDMMTKEKRSKGSNVIPT
jgi:hypothetical protein